MCTSANLDCSIEDADNVTADSGICVALADDSLPANLVTAMFMVSHNDGENTTGELAVTQHR